MSSASSDAPMPVADHEVAGVTIDAAHSLDLDDAIWVERTTDGWRVTVSVADVAGTVEAGGVVDLAAAARGATRYAATRSTTTMLPPDLSEGMLSLLPGMPRDVVACRLSLSDELDVLDVSLERGVLNHQGRLDHEAAEALIDSDPDGMMARAWRLASALLSARMDGGALAFVTRGDGVATDEEGRPVFGQASNRAHVVVQELMILANAATATWMAASGRHMLFRNHRASPVADRSALAEDLEIAVGGGSGAPAAVSRLEMFLGRATLSSKATGHFGLNLPVYAWTTSPLRRYADLVNQRLILAAVDGREPPYGADQLDVLAARLNDQARKEADRRSEAFKLRSEQAAGRMIDPALLSAASDAEIKARVKAAEAGRGPTEALSSELAIRLSEGRLPIREVVRLLVASGAGFDALRQSVLDAMMSNPSEAVTALTILQQISAASAASFSQSSSAGSFSCAATITMEPGARTVVGARALGSTKKEAYARSCLLAIAAALVPRWSGPGHWTTGGTGRLAPDGPTWASTSPAEEEEAKNTLQVLCQRNKWTLPVYAVVAEGPPHAPTFEATVSIPSRDGVGRGGVRATRKAAEKSAASALLRLLSGDGGTKGDARS